MIGRHSAGWREIGGKKNYYRSRWEANYARYLQLLKDKGAIKDWEHEPKDFWFEDIKRGVRSYKPDFRVDNVLGGHYWVEVKGYMDAKSKTKIARFAKYYPKEILKIVDKKWFSSYGKIYSYLEGWETGVCLASKIRVNPFKK